MVETTVFEARKVLTLDPDTPEGTHIAVRDGRILAVGDRECGTSWGTVRHDRRLCDMVVMPGFVEGHAHMMAGAMWRFAYVGYHDRTDPDGRLWPGLGEIDGVVDRLREARAGLDADAPLVGWGFDPIFLSSDRLSARDLDRIDADRPIAVIYSNFHLMCVNSAALRLVGYGRETNVEGVVKGPDGQPTGELQEMAAMFPILRRLGVDFRALGQSADAIQGFGKLAMRAGVTTITDLYSTMTDADLDEMLRVTGAPDFPVRIVPALGVAGGDPARMAEQALTWRACSTDRLRLGAVKLMTDGSIQGWTARVRWPGYVGGQPNGLWNMAPEEIHAMAAEMQRRGVQMHIHVNGDEAAEVSLDALGAAAQLHPWPGARHVLQHCQMMETGLFTRAAELGVACNLFSNHLWFFGDQHVALTLGPDRASRMNATRSALTAGVRIAIHSDAPVTPLAPLFTAGCAVARRTMSGRVLGSGQALSIDEALSAITKGAAYTLKLDGEIGRLAPGMRADFALLGSDPTAASPEALGQVPVLGTVLGGEVHLL